MVPLVEIFCFIDDFCKSFSSQKNTQFLPNPNRKRNKSCQMTLSEIMTILVLFHLSHYRNFKDFYLSCLCVYYRKDFPKLVSYNRFIELKPHAAMPLAILIFCIQGKNTGKYFVDSTKLQVSHNLRIKRHKVFKEIAKRGVSSTGWFFGFKLHLIINDLGEIMSFHITPGNTDDRSVVKKMTQGLRGWLFGDKGYIGKEFKEKLSEDGIEMITNLKKNMKKTFLDPIKKVWLKKRGIIETIIGQLKEIFHIQHTRHRSVSNFYVNVFAGIIAYILKPKKPSVSFGRTICYQPLLTSS